MKALLYPATCGLLVAALSLSAAAQDAPSKPPRKMIEATPEQIATWVKELDADEFAKREEATECLICAGRASIEKLAACDLPSQNLEVITRGIHVLQELSLSDDRETEDAARDVLETLAASENGSAARRATAVLAVLNEARQERAMEDLERAGIKVALQSRQVGPVLLQEVMTVVVDESFTGKLSELRRLKYLPSVELVELSGERITDEALKYLEGMSGVEYLTIKRAKITNKAVGSLKKIEKLKHLSIMYSPIDDGAIDELATVKSLIDVKVFGTKMTRDGAGKLAAALGNIEVDFRDGAFLGIGCTAGRGGCEVTIVHETSAAFKAGISPGDTIVKFAGEPVPDFRALTTVISKYKAGDKVTFEIIKGDNLDGKIEKVDVTLGAWE